MTAKRVLRIELLGDAKDAAKAFDDVGKASDGLLDNLAGLGGALGGAVLTGHIEDSTVSLGKLRAQLGLTEDETAELGSVARDVYANNFGESIGEATQVAGLLHQALGTTGDALQEATEDVFRITDAFGHLGAEPGIIAENVRVMKQAFPDKSDAEILDIIAAGFQEGAGRSGDLQDTLQEYPRFFSEIGLSAEDMKNFLVDGLEAGARNSDLLGDAVKEMGIIIQEEGSKGQERISKIFGDDQAEQLIKNFGAGGEAGREAFFTILEGLNSIEDPLERNQAAVDLFGTKGEDLAGVLDGMLPSFLATKDSMNEVGDVTGSLDAQYVGMQSTLEGLKRRFESALIGPLGGVAAPAQEAITAFGGVGTALLGLSGLGINVGGIISGLGSKLLAAVAPTNLMAGAQAALNVIMAANPILLVVVALAALTAGLVLAYQNSETFRDIVNGAFNGIREVVQPVLAFLTTEVPAAFQAILSFVSEHWPLIITLVLGPLGLLITQVVAHWDQIRAVIATAMGAIQDVIVTVLGFIQAHWGTVWGAIRATAEGVWAGIQAAASVGMAAIQAIIAGTLGPIQAHWDTIWGAIRATAEAVWNGAGGIVLTVDLGINKVRQFIQQALDTIKGIWDTVWGGLSSVVDSVWNGAGGVVSTVSTGISNVRGQFDGALGWLFEAGQDMIQGFIDGMLSMGQAAVDAALGVGRDAIDAITSFGLSPWPAMMAAGRDAATGFVIGMLSVQDEIRRVGGRLAVAAIEGTGARLRAPVEPRKSEEGYDMGRLFGMGMALGLQDSEDDVSRQGAKLAKATLGGFTDGMVGGANFGDSQATGGAAVVDAVTDGGGSAAATGGVRGGGGSTSVFRGSVTGLITHDDRQTGPPRTGAEFRWAFNLVAYRISDQSSSSELIDAMILAMQHDRMVHYTGGQYGPEGSDAPGRWAQRIINRARSAAVQDDLTAAATGAGLELSGATLRRTSGGFNTGSGFNITINAPNANPNAIAESVRFALLSMRTPGRLVGSSR